MLTITPEQAEAFILERQYLSVPAKDPLDMIHRLGAIQAQYAANVPLAFWSRTDGVTMQWVEEALAKTRSIEKTWCMRGTLHAVASDDLGLFVSSLGISYAQRVANYLIKDRGYTPESVERLCHDILDALGSDSLTRSEIHDRVPELADMPWTGWGLDMKILVYRGEVVFSTPKDGTTSCFVRREVWNPQYPLTITDETEARRELLRRYLASHAPARAIDFAYWTSLSTVLVRRLFESMGDELIAFKIGGRDDVFYALASDERLLYDAPPSAAINVLPKFDALMLAHKDKARHLPAHNHKHVYRKAGQIESVILLYGHVAATWRLKLSRRALDITIEPHRKFKAAEKRLIDREFERLAGFYGVGTVNVSLASD